MKTGSHLLLYIAGLFGLLAVWVSSIAKLETMDQKVWVSFILLAITLLFSLQHNMRKRTHGSLIRNLLQTLLAGSLFVFEPGWSVFPIVFFVLSPQVMIDFPLKIGVVWLSVYTLITGFFMVSADGLAGLLNLLPYLAGYAFFGLFGWTMVQAQAEKERSEHLLADLKITHEKLQRYTEQMQELTIADERNRIAREMHDTLGHRLTIVSVQLEGAQRLIFTNPQKVEQILGTVREQVREGLSELRRTVAMMRASVDEDFPINQALKRLVSQVKEATGLNLHLEMEENLPEFSMAYKQALFRAAQEGLTNIQRHASATVAWIRLYKQDNQVVIQIEDNGVGMALNQPGKGLGLTGLEERVTLLKGELKIHPRSEGGTQIKFCLPLREGDSNE